MRCRADLIRGVLAPALALCLPACVLQNDAPACQQAARMHPDTEVFSTPSHAASPHTKARQHVPLPEPHAPRRRRGPQPCLPFVFSVPMRPSLAVVGALLLSHPPARANSRRAFHRHRRCGRGCQTQHARARPSSRRPRGGSVSCVPPRVQGRSVCPVCRGGERRAHGHAPPRTRGSPLHAARAAALRSVRQRFAVRRVRDDWRTAFGNGAACLRVSTPLSFGVLACSVAVCAAARGEWCSGAASVRRVWQERRGEGRAPRASPLDATPTAQRAAALPHTLTVRSRFLPALRDGGALFGEVTLPSAAQLGSRSLTSPQNVSRNVSRNVSQMVSCSKGWRQQSDTETLAALADALEHTCKWFRLEPRGDAATFCGYK